MSNIFAAVALAVALNSPGQAASPLGDDPSKFDQLLDGAMLRRDVLFVEAAVAADVRITSSEPDAPALDKQKFVDAVRTYVGLARTVDSVQVDERGDSVETRGHIRVRVALDPFARDDPSAAPESQIYFVRLYRRGPAGWQLVSHRTVRVVAGALATSVTPPGALVSPNAVLDTPTPVRPGNGVTLPRPLKEVKPRYTADAMRARIQGSVLMECVIRTDGSVGDVKVLHSLDRVNGLDDEAIIAAKQWRFEPGTRNGQPVPVIVTIELSFTLGKP